MPLTISLIGKGVIANADGYSDTATSGSTWNEDGGGTDSFSGDTYLYGSLSFAGAYSAKSGWQYFDIGSGNVLDFTPSTGSEAGQFLWLPISCPTLGLLQTIANKGLTIRVGSSLTDYWEWDIGGSDDSNGWLGVDWKCFVIDPTEGGSRTVGSPNIASVRYMGVWIDTSALAKGDNIFISQILCASGLRIEGTSTDVWNDVISYCTDYSNRAYTMIMEKEGIGFALGSFVFGNTAQTADTDVSGSSQTVKFARSEYWNGSAWVSTYPTNANLINFEENVTYSTTYDLSDSSISGANGSTFSYDGADVALNLSGGSSVACQAIFDSTDTLNGHVFAGCPAVKPNGASVSNIAISSTLEASTGALEIVSSSDLLNISGVTFSKYSGKNALYIPASVTGTISLNGFIGDGSGTDVYWAGTSGTLTINKSGGTNLSSWNSAGGTVSLVSSVSIDVHVEDQSGSDIVGAYVYIDEDLESAGEIINTTSSSTGDVSTSYSGSATSATVRIRKYGFKPYSGTISLTSDTNLNVTLVTDPQQI